MKLIGNSLLLLVFLIPFNCMGSTTSLDSDYKSGLSASEYNNGAGSDRTVSSVVIDVISFFLTFLAVLAVIVILVSGILYITSGGDEGKVETAKKWIMNAIIGLVIALLAWVIVNIVSNAILS